MFYVKPRQNNNGCHCKKGNMKLILYILYSLIIWKNLCAIELLGVTDTFRFPIHRQAQFFEVILVK